MSVLELRYRHLSEAASARWGERGFPPVTRERLDQVVARLFVDLVELERAIEDDDERTIHGTLAEVALDALAALHDLGEPWCLRTPRHHRGRHQSGARLTATLRGRAQAVLRYWDQGAHRDATIALELVVKSALELASTLDFSLDIAIAGRTRPRGHRAPHPLGTP